MRLKDKNIILGITGSIAAYKAAFLTRLLKKEGANVKIILTPYGKEFITPVTLATLSQNSVLMDFFHHDDGSWNSHVDLGIWADAMLIAPITANTIAKMAHGVADNLLITTYLSARCPVIIAPAMDLDMFQHPTTLENIKKLESFGNIVIEPSTGELASGLEGKGRMEDPDKIVDFLVDFFQKKKKLSNKSFLVTAGPTYEKIDPVRFIGNFSSGKMGYAIAEELANQGASVVLVSGPTNLSISHPLINKIDVVSADEMFEKSTKHFPNTDGAILSAAVADYKPKNFSSEKIKRKDNELEIQLTPNKDIAKQLGSVKSDNQVLVGFALETTDEILNAQKKIKSKNLDFIIMNSLKEKGAGFSVDTNKVSIIDKNNNIEDFKLKQKSEVAKDIVKKLISYYE